MVGECALCGNVDTLKLSHIIPKFVFRYLKKDSFTGRLRQISDPNRPIQDGDKQELLCGVCEERFSAKETKFTNNIYHPFKQSGFTETTYEEGWLHYFITSVNWRTLLLDIASFEHDEDQSNKITDKQLAQLKKAEKIMREYLLGERREIDSIENHIFFFDTIESAGGGVAHLDIYSALHGSAFGYTVVNSLGAIYVFANLTGILIVTVIKKHSKEVWKNTYVKLSAGKIKTPQIVKESPLTGEFFFLAEQRETFMGAMSDKQKNQILDKIKKDRPGFEASGTYRRTMEDRRINP